MTTDKPAKCKFCGEDGFWWRKRPDGNWEMIDRESNTRHECASAKRYFDNKKAQEAKMAEIKRQANLNREGYL